MKADFNFIPARSWADWKFPIITFWGSSGHYIKVAVNANTEPTLYIILDGCHVATKHMGRVTFNPKHTFPKGFKSACKSIH